MLIKLIEILLLKGIITEKEGDYIYGKIPCGNNKRWCESCISKGKCEVTRNGISD